MAVASLEAFRLKVVANKRCFYGDRLHFEPESKLNPKRAGQEFTIRADALKYDQEGRMHVTKDLKPLLPTWANPLEEVQPIAKDIPHVVVEQGKLKRGERKVPAAVKAVAPAAWPKNVRRNQEMSPDRPIKIKRAGTGTIPGEQAGDDENEG